MRGLQPLNVNTTVRQNASTKSCDVVITKSLEVWCLVVKIVTKFTRVTKELEVQDLGIESSSNPPNTPSPPLPLGSARQDPSK